MLHEKEVNLILEAARDKGLSTEDVVKLIENSGKETKKSSSFPWGKVPKVPAKKAVKKK